MTFCGVNKIELDGRENVLYLAHRHPAQTGVEYTCSSIGTHLTHKGKSLPPVYTVGLDLLPVRDNTFRNTSSYRNKNTKA